MRSESRVRGERRKGRKDGVRRYKGTRDAYGGDADGMLNRRGSREGNEGRDADGEEGKGPRKRRGK